MGSSQKKCLHIDIFLKTIILLVVMYDYSMIIQFAALYMYVSVYHNALLNNQ